MWDARAEHVLAIHRVDDPGASELYLRWWFLAGKRFLGADAAHADVRLTQLPVEASQRVPTAHEPLLRVDDVSTIGLSGAVAGVAEEDGGMTGGDEAADGQDGGDGEPSGGSVPRTPGASTQGYVDETQQFFGSPGGLSLTVFLALPPWSSSLVPKTHTMPTLLDVYRSHLRVHTGDPRARLKPAHLLTLMSRLLIRSSTFLSHLDANDQAPPAAEDPEPRRGRRAIRRRGCGTGGHM
ncbi:hypothetical protein PIB30_064361 [Stylosanthes scabra]|uniref:Uncharacterized protein n=1 Tax=Stylosanthes scabra TaxID=79078 RepID=A0ABU6UQG3_9FABA|nr:hypothetical protein [Stylosanthes scabra]